MPPQELGRAGRRAGARVEQRDRDLPPRERLIDHRKVPDHGREKGEAGSRFDDGDRLGERAAGHHIAEAEGEERRAAHVHVRPEPAAATARHRHRRARRPLQQPEGADAARRPQGEQGDERERPIKGKKRVPAPAREQPGRGAPRRPGVPVEHLGEADPPAHPPRQDDGLERVPQDYGQQHHAPPTADPAHVRRSRAQRRLTKQSD